jgi:hypothetical protein
VVTTLQICRLNCYLGRSGKTKIHRYGPVGALSILSLK